MSSYLSNKFTSKLVILLLFVGVAIPGFSQRSPSATLGRAPQSLTLESCIEYAIKNNPNVKRAQLDEVANQYQIKEIKSGALPQISGQAQGTDNFSLAEQLLPGEVFGQPGTTIPVKFGVRYNLNATVQANQMLYNPSFFAGLKAAEASQSLIELSTFKTIEDLVYNVAQVYLQVQQLEQQGTILEANMVRLEQLLGIAEIQFEEGLIKKIDVDQLSVNRTNLQTEQTNLNLNISQMYRVLKLYMNFPLDAELELIDFIEEGTGYELASELQLASNTQLRLLEKQQELNSLELKNTQAGYLPSLSAFARYGWQGQTDGLFNEEYPLQDFTSGSWGISLNVPIFDGGQKLNQAQRIRVRREQLTLDRAYLTQATQMEFANANERLSQNRRVLEAQRKNMVLAGELYDVSQLSYQEGVAPLTELLNAETSLKEAQTQYLTALFQLKLSELDHLKTSGQLANMIQQSPIND